MGQTKTAIRVVDSLTQRALSQGGVCPASVQSARLFPGHCLRDEKFGLDGGAFVLKTAKRVKQCVALLADGGDGSHFAKAIGHFLRQPMRDVGFRCDVRRREGLRHPEG